MPITSVNYEYQPGLFQLDELDDDGQVTPAEARLRSETARNMLGRMEKLPHWYEEYTNLVNGGWPWRVAAYIAWASSPKVNRWPATQEKLAIDVLGLTSDRQIIKWRKNNQAIVDTISAMQVAPMMAHRADVVDALIKSAIDPDYKGHRDRKLLLEMTGDYLPTSKLIARMKKSMPNGPEGMSSDELDQYAGWEEDEE
jgi:hypothetical protein